jgi:hypothetical protein
MMVNENSAMINKSDQQSDRNTRSKSTSIRGAIVDRVGKRKLTVSTKLSDDTFFHARVISQGYERTSSATSFSVGQAKAPEISYDSDFQPEKKQIVHIVQEEDTQSFMKIRPFDLSPRSSSSSGGTSSVAKSKKPKSISDALNTATVLNYIQTLIMHTPAAILDSPVTVDRDACSEASSFDDTVIERMSYRDISKHISSLRIEHVQKIVRPLVTKLMLHPKNSNIFNSPVDPIALQIPDYFARISHPMDLGTIKSRVQRGYYDCISATINDISLVFKNAMSFNPASHFIHQIAKQIKLEFDADLQALDEKAIKEVNIP